MPIHDILTTAAALVAVTGMILLVRFGFRLTGLAAPRPGAGGALSLDASLSLDTKRRVCLVSCQGRQVLLLTGGTSDILLGWLPGTHTGDVPGR